LASSASALSVVRIVDTAAGIRLIGGRGHHIRFNAEATQRVSMPLDPLQPGRRQAVRQGAINNSSLVCFSPAKDYGRA